METSNIIAVIALVISVISIIMSYKAGINRVRLDWLSIEIKGLDSIIGYEGGREKMAANRTFDCDYFFNNNEM